MFEQGMLQSELFPEEHKEEELQRHSVAVVDLLVKVKVVVTHVSLNEHEEQNLVN